jgi:predicted permease
MPVAAQMLERVRAIPGVASAAVVKDAPLLGFGEQMEFTIPARGEQPDGQEPVAQIIPVSREFFRTMGIPLLGGVDLSSDIGDSAAFEVVINEAAARRYWPDLNPFGEELQMGEVRLTIAGVAEDVRYATVDTVSAPAIYVPTRLMARRVVTFVVRARPGQDPGALVPAMRTAIRAVDRDQPFTRIGTMGDVVGDAVAAPRFLTMLVGAFGGLAMLLAAIGVYGVVSFLVGQRTNEIGVRLALGAQPRDVATWALRTGMASVLAGVAIGTAAALAIARVLDSQLYQVSATDPLVFSSVAGVLIAVSLLASAIPAIRAARFAPTVALRHD